VGLRSRLFARLARAEHPVLVAAVGAAFALSFDTVSQAVLFSLTGSNLAGWMFATSLGLVFTAGMMATDALNGLWVSRMLERSDAQQAIASRVMGAAIGTAALAVAAAGVWRYASPGDSRESWGMVLGFAVIASVAAAYALGQRLNCRST
jgi:high-affinity nickel-transport protein